MLPLKCPALRWTADTTQTGPLSLALAACTDDMSLPWLHRIEQREKGTSGRGCSSRCVVCVAVTIPIVIVVAATLGVLLNQDGKNSATTRLQVATFGMLNDGRYEIYNDSHPRAIPQSRATMAVTRYRMTVFL